ncbi:Uma2 family endonuclease [Nostoc sp. C052]|uniref:Uma2 family endonuclease n=1 Tax=Nostoc sp. C052 TaxID=2576902 RepID=UPI0015C2D6BB|nr:Uma2 family endonuclease [Nostoc sp. C052]QLE39695.1 Uma2 family endonuclease [Nostoc sp. C052]
MISRNIQGYYKRLALFTVAVEFRLPGKYYYLIFKYLPYVRLWILGYRRYTYPDVMAIAGEPVYESDSTTTVTNPLIIIEVLSKSTRSYDESDKFRCYRSIPELQEYILIDQYKFYLEQFAKNSDSKWVLTEYESPDALLTLASINFQISFSDIYEMVNF